MNYDNQDPDNGDDDRKRDSSRKRDGKRDKKEKGYQMFEEEDSEEEQLMLAEDIKSPNKQKKEKVKASFKFPVRKEKTKEKEEKKDKEAKKEEKEKKREEKEGKKLKKDKKKSKHAPPAAVTIVPSQYENPIFGVPLAVAVERNKSHDGIELPAIVRECIDYIEECGLACEGIYRISGVKSKVQHLKDCYNRHDPVYLFEHEPNVVASLLKQFLRDLPEPVLTTALMPKFEEASVIKNNKKKNEAFLGLIDNLPPCNRLLLSWMIVHMTHVIELAKENKMTLQNVSIVLSPTMQISHRVLNILFSNVHTLFAGLTLRKYVPPLKPAHSKWSLELPDNPAALEEELAKQESLLNQLHADLNSGVTDPEIEEQLWEVQRVVTQLKRKIKTAKKNIEMGERRKSNLESKKSSNTSLPSLSAPEELHLQLRTAPDPNQPHASTVTTVTAVVEKPPPDRDVSPASERRGVRFAQSPSQSPTQSQDGETGTTVQAEANKEEEKEEAVTEKAAAENQDQRQDDSAPDTSAKPQEEPRTDETSSKSSREQSVEKTTDAEPQPGTAQKEKEKTPESSQPAEKAPEAETKDKKPDSETPQSQETESKDSAESLTVAPEEKRVRKKSPAPQPEGAIKFPSEEKKSTKKSQAPSVPGSQDRTPEPSPQRDATVQPAPSPSAPGTLDTKPQSPPPKDAMPQAIPQKDESPTSSLERQTSLPEQKVELEPAPVVVRPPEIKKQPIPPFMSTAVLQPMKAEPPRAKPVVSAQDEERERERLRQDERLRELEEELLGVKKKKVLPPKKEEKKLEEKLDEVDHMDIDQLIEQEYALGLEEEELLAIADELRQKIATESSEMERLTQEIQELQYLRQDSDLEDLSSSSSSSEDSDDEEDLMGYLLQLLQENQDLETNNADMCQKIHEERMICLSVKLQIRLLQQKQLEASYG